jgi:lauroyl/myristoyl acyltransferase
MPDEQVIPRETPDVSRHPFPRASGDIQTAVVALVDRLAPLVPVSRQPVLAREIAEVIASRPSSMANNMFVRQSIIRHGTATHDQVIEGLAAWVTVLFDLGNLQHDRERALQPPAVFPDEDVGRLSRAISRSSNGCILAVPHTGSLELFAAHLIDRGFEVGFVYTIGRNPTPTEQWLYRGRSATGATGIPFGRKNTGLAIAGILRRKGVVIMVVDVYPSDKYHGVRVRIFDGDFNHPPGPARFARTGTLVLPGFASRRSGEGLSLTILDPLDDPAGIPVSSATSEFTQRLAVAIEKFTTRQPDAYWLWHPIPNDPYLAVAQRQRPELLRTIADTLPDDEEVALAVEAMSRRLTP